MMTDFFIVKYVIYFLCAMYIILLRYKFADHTLVLAYFALYFDGKINFQFS